LSLSTFTLIRSEGILSCVIFWVAWDDLDF